MTLIKNQLQGRNKTSHCFVINSVTSKALSMIYHYELYSSIHNQVASPSGEYKYIDAREDAMIDG